MRTGILAASYDNYSALQSNSNSLFMSTAFYNPLQPSPTFSHGYRSQIEVNAIKARELLQTLVSSCEKSAEIAAKSSSNEKHSHDDTKESSSTEKKRRHRSSITPDRKHRRESSPERKSSRRSPHGERKSRRSDITPDKKTRRSVSSEKRSRSTEIPLSWSDFKKGKWTYEKLRRSKLKNPK